MNDMAALLRQLRDERGVSLRHLADRAGISRRTLSYWEAGTYQPRVPELESVLSSLAATPEERRRILALLDAPRAVAVLRQEGERTDWGAAPLRGDLLRAMRLRRGRTLEEAAHETGIGAGVLSRWERSEMWPEPERLATLCRALGARAEEWQALSSGRIAAGGGFASAEELRCHAERFGQFSHLPEHIPLVDLNFHALCAALWTPAQEQPASRILLGQVHAAYADFLLGQNRYQECERVGMRAQDFLCGSRHTEQEFTLAAVRAAEAVKLRGGRRGAQRAESILRDITAFARDPFRRVWILTQLGQTLITLGNREEAVPLSQDALTLLEPQPNSWQRREGLDQVIRLLANAGFPREALHVTERYDAIRKMHPSDPLRMAAIMQQLNRPQEAQQWLLRAVAVLENPAYCLSDNVAYVPIFRRRADEIAAQM